MAFDLTTYQIACCAADTPVLRLSRNQQIITAVTIRDNNGDAVDLTALPATSGLQLSSSSDSGGVDLLNVSVILGLGNFYGKGVILTLNGTILDAEAGQVQFTWTASDTDRSGMFVATVGVLVDETLVFQMPIYVEFESTVFRADDNSTLSIADVRAELLDNCPGANYLLDSLEYDDSSIMRAMRRAVDTYNETNPPCSSYTYSTFPFRSNWLKATVAYLLQSIAHRYRRNKMSYQAGGVAISDQEKAEEYLELGMEMEKAYLAWVVQTKVAVNIGLGYGSSQRSPYGW